jgi:hypothetical protein
MLLVGGQDHAYSFLNARNREEAAQRLQTRRSLVTGQDPGCVAILPGRAFHDLRCS